MQRLLYVSTSRMPVSPANLADILAASRRNNRRDGLTGLLVVGRQRFLQVLEGDAEALERTYARIRRDLRHFALVELERRSVEQRGFPDWDMGCRNGFRRDDESLAAIVDRLTEGVEDLSLRAHLRGFAELHSAAA